MNKKIHVGIAGLGRSGWSNHLLTLLGLPAHFQVAAVTDPNPDRCREAVEKTGCRTLPDLKALLADKELDAVVLATPSQLHCEQALQAFAAGKHVICEKPMASNSDEARKMILAASRAGRHLAVFQNLRYNPAFLKVREVLASGKLGRILEIRICAHNFSRRWDWQTLKEFSGGELNNTGPHHLDQALQLFGPTDPEVFCHMDRALTSGDAEDHVKVILKAPSAPLIEIEISRASVFPLPAWHVMGTCGTLTGSTSELKWRFTDFTGMPARPVERQPTPDRSYNRETYSWVEETWKQPSDLPETKEQAFYQDLHRTLGGDAPLTITPESILRQIVIIEKCRALCPEIYPLSRS